MEFQPMHRSILVGIHAKCCGSSYLRRKTWLGTRHSQRPAGSPRKDCEVIAKLLVAESQHDEAMAWADRGLTLFDTNGHGASNLSLKTLRRPVLVALGRRGEALQDAWEKHSKSHAVHTYTALMTLVPDAERATWHDKALAATKGARLDAALELRVHVSDVERFADLLRETSNQAIEELSHNVSEPAAELLGEAHPELAARLWRAQGMRILNAARSGLYTGPRFQISSKPKKALSEQIA